MKKIILVLLIVVTAFTLSAEPHRRGTTPEEILDLFPGIGEKTVSQLTIDERLNIAGKLSVQMQESMYVRHASISSFLIPGAGQFMTGDPLSGTIHLAGEAAIIGGVITGLYFLLPEDLKDSSLTRDERHDLFKSYDRYELLPAMGVVAGGVLLSLFNSITASRGAAENALENIETGAVIFKPYVNIGNTLGLGFRMHW